MNKKSSKDVGQRQITVADRVLHLERLVQKVIRKSFKDSTLDYNVQIACSSVEPGVVKYAFMINGLKKEIQPIAMSYSTYEECEAVLEGLMKDINPIKVEKMFHQGRINVYKNAISSHEERLQFIEDHPDQVLEDAEIPMEELAAEKLAKAEPSDEE